MDKKLFSAILILFLLAALTNCSQEKAASSEKYLRNLKREHPRLILTDERLEKLKEMRLEDAHLDQLIRIMINKADETLELPDIEFKPDARNIILDASRNARERLLDLSMAYRFTRDKKYLNEAVNIIRTVASFPTWNPAHFLDVAEMTAGVAVAYDWLYNDLDYDSRDFIKNVIVEKGLQDGLIAYSTDSMDVYWEDKVNWRIMENNWYFVTTGGLTLGALAVAEDYPEIAEEIIKNGLQDIQKSIVRFAPDGVWYEGPGYWGYSVYYLAQLLSGLESALGHDFNLSATEGLDKTSSYYVNTTSPSGNVFSFADSGNDKEHRWFNPAFLWFVKKYNPQDIADYTQNEVKRAISKNFSEPLGIAWYVVPENKSEYSNSPMVGYYFGDVDLFCFKSLDSDTNALYFIAKSGDNAINHQQLDIGTFVIETEGVLWGIDMGAGNYDLPGFFKKEIGGQRWSYYRNQNKSHSTLVFGDRIQKVSGKGEFIKTYEGQNPGALLDMTSAYEDEAERVLRGYRIIDHTAVLIQDEISGIIGEDSVRWGFVTDSEITIEKNTAILSKNDKTFYLKILTPGEASFAEISSKPPTEDENQNDGIRMLVFYLKQKHTGDSITLSVVMSQNPKFVKEYGIDNIQKLDQWN